MCGIAGFSLSDQDLERVNPRTLTKRLGLAIEHRGTDATGIAYPGVDKDGVPVVWYAKHALRARDYLTVARLQNIERDTRMMMVHTRAATQGRPEDNNNNHPIHVPSYNDRPGCVGVHNGIIWNDYNVWKRYPEFEQYRQGQVDSEIIFHLLAQKGLDSLDALNGDASIAWATTDANDVLNIARLGGRELAIARTKGGSLLFASTKACLESALSFFGQLDVLYVNNVAEGEFLTVVDGEIIERDEAPVIALAGYYGGWTTRSSGTGTSRRPIGHFDDSPFDDLPPRPKAPAWTPTDRRTHQLSLEEANEERLDSFSSTIRDLTLETVKDKGLDADEFERALFNYYFGSSFDNDPDALQMGLTFIYRHASGSEYDSVVDHLATKLLAEQAKEAEAEAEESWSSAIEPYHDYDGELAQLRQQLENQEVTDA